MQYKLWCRRCCHLNVHCTANVYFQSFSHISNGKCLISQKSWLEKTLHISVRHRRRPRPHMSCDERHRRRCRKWRRWNWAKANLLQAMTLHSHLQAFCHHLDVERSAFIYMCVSEFFCKLQYSVLHVYDSFFRNILLEVAIISFFFICQLDFHYLLLLKISTML